MLTNSPTANDVTTTGRTELVLIHFADLDAMGVVHNCRYVLLFERALAAYWTRAGWPFDPGAPRFAEAFFAVRESGITYHVPITCVGTVQVQLWLGSSAPPALCTGSGCCPRTGLSCTPKGAACKSGSTRNAAPAAHRPGAARSMRAAADRPGLAGRTNPRRRRGVPPHHACGRPGRLEG